MRQQRPFPCFSTALACLLCLGCMQRVEQLFECVASEPAAQCVNDPVPLGARRAASRQEIVEALTLPEGRKPTTPIVATLDEVWDTCPLLSQCLNQRTEAAEETLRTQQDEESPAWTPVEPRQDEKPKTRSVKGGSIRMSDITLHVDAGDRTFVVTLLEPRMCNGCVYGYLGSCTCEDSSR